MDIFIIDTKKADNIEPELLKKFCYKNFTQNEKEKIHCLAYLMLDRIFKTVYGIDSPSLIFENKKPKLKNQKKYFSISHSNEYIAITISDFECGVDIEETKNRDYKKISKRMNFKSDSLEDFYLNWTKYESEYKLGSESKSTYSFKIPKYIITAASTNKNESFDVFFSL